MSATTTASYAYFLLRRENDKRKESNIHQQTHFFFSVDFINHTLREDNRCVDLLAGIVQKMWTT
jgi:hypothetical protein